MFTFEIDSENALVGCTLGLGTLGPTVELAKEIEKFRCRGARPNLNLGCVDVHRATGRAATLGRVTYMRSHQYKVHIRPE